MVETCETRYTLVSSSGIAKGMPDRAQIPKIFALLYHPFVKRSRESNKAFKHSIKAVSKTFGYLNKIKWWCCGNKIGIMGKNFWKL